MKILHTVEFYHPLVGGMAEVVRQLSERLVKLGHDVTVATGKVAGRTNKTINGVTIKEFDISGNDVRGLTGDIDEYKKFLITSSFDIVSNFQAQQWATDIALPLLDQIKGKKIFIPTGFTYLYEAAYTGYYERMKTFMQSYDMNVFLSHNFRDINFARKNGISKTIVIPNGAGEDEFLTGAKIDIRKKYNIGPTDFFILHVGSYTGIKGHVEALKIYLKSRISDGVFLFAGNENTAFERFVHTHWRFLLWKIFNFPQRKKRYIIAELSRVEIVSALKQADLFLFPSQVECSPIVLFEAMASRTPFLCTDVGNTKEIIEWSNGGELLPTKINKKGYSHVSIKKAAKCLTSFYKNKKKIQELGNNGFNAWKKSFSWEIIVKKYEQLYIDLLKN